MALRATKDDENGRTENVFNEAVLARNGNAPSIGNSYRAAPGRKRCVERSSYRAPQQLPSRAQDDENGSTENAFNGAAF